MTTLFSECKDHRPFHVGWRGESRPPPIWPMRSSCISLVHCIRSLVFRLWSGRSKLWLDRTERKVHQNWPIGRICRQQHHHSPCRATVCKSWACCDWDGPQAMSEGDSKPLDGHGLMLFHEAFWGFMWSFYPQHCRANVGPGLPMPD